MKGKVGRAFHKASRWKNDMEYRELQIKMIKAWNEKNKEKLKEYNRMKIQQLNEFKNRRCKKCNKLLNYKTEGNYCFEHFIKRKRKLKEKKK